MERSALPAEPSQAVRARGEETVGTGDALVFRRDAESRILGAIAYLLATPVAAGFLGLILAVPIGLVLDQLGVGRVIVGIVELLVFACCAIAMVKWAINDFRRRSSYALAVYCDRFELQENGRCKVIRFTELRDLRLVRRSQTTACDLLLQSGAASQLLEEVAPYSALRTALDRYLAPVFSRRVVELLDRDRSLVVKDSRTRGIPGLVIAVGGISLCAAAVFVPFMEILGMHRIGGAVEYLRIGRRRLGGGFRMRREGIIPRGASAEQVVAWNAIDRVDFDSAGLIVFADGVAVAQASLYAVHYQLAAAFLSGLVAAKQLDRRGAPSAASGP